MKLHTLLSALLLAAAASAAHAASPHDKPGFETFEVDGRLWVFKADSKDLEEFRKHGEPVKVYTEIGVGPNGMTVKSADEATVKAYVEALKQS